MVYTDCPLDARDFTDYRSTSDINNELIVSNNIQNNFEYNKFITNNATKIINQYRNKIEKIYKCGPHGNTMLNEQYKQHCTKDNCEVKPFDMKGLGMGREFNSQENLLE
tara:strand:+ start:114 stop:440 length:327 start_codon:yes stop_codon:yes gene_type:complete